MAAYLKSTKFEAIWASLQKDLDLLYRGEGISAEAHVRCYNVIYAHCNPHRLPAPTRKRTVSARSRALPLSSVSSALDSDAFGSNLYQKLEEYLTALIDDVGKQLANTDGEDALLKRYADAWSAFSLSSQVADGIFRYFNCTWVARKRTDDVYGVSGVFPVYLLCLRLWKRRILEEESGRIGQAAVNLITRERNGESVEVSVLKTFVSSLEALEATLEEAFSKHPRVYVDFFEWKFLEATQDYFRLEANQSMQQRSIVEFMVNAEKRFSEEEVRVRRCLNSFSALRVVYILEQVFIYDHLPRLHEEFERLLEEDRDEDVNRMFRLCSRVHGGLQPLRASFERFVVRKGEDKVSELLLSGGDVEPSPKEYVDALLKIHKRYTNLVADADFVKAFDTACISFMNENALTRRAGSGRVSRSAELLARHVDVLLRKGGERDNLEASLSDAVVIFKYLSDKDSFQKFYTAMLSKRLIAGISIDTDSEEFVISKLRSVAGFDYTNRFHRMFNDLQGSKELNQTFQKISGSTNDQLNAIVVCSAFWPFKEGETCSLPPVLQQSLSDFESFYAAQHQGRKLTWIVDASRAELRTNCFTRTYTLWTTTPQMAMLTKFNESLMYTLEELKKCLGMSEETVNAAIQSLLVVKILQLPEGTLPTKSLPGSTQVSLNCNFERKKQRIDLARLVKALKPEKQTEAEQTEKTLVKDRKMEIQAALVRVMKMRITMKHADLVAEVIAQLSSRFTPEVASIKENIEDLIAKDYVKRVEGDRKSYEFIA